MRHDANTKGSIAELEIAAAATRLGICVLAPLTEHSRYDFVFDAGGRLLRIQCKWATLRDGVVMVPLNTSRHTPRGYVRTAYSTDEIDAVAAYCAENDACYVIPAALAAGRRAISLRLEPPRNGQRACLNWAENYELGAIAQLGERVAGSDEVAGSSPAGSTESPSSSASHVGAHEFRERFGWYMERAAAGQEIVVTRRGRPSVRMTGVAVQPPLAATPRR